MRMTKLKYGLLIVSLLSGSPLAPSYSQAELYTGGQRALAEQWPRGSACISITEDPSSPLLTHGKGSMLLAEGKPRGTKRCGPRDAMGRVEDAHPERLPKNLFAFAAGATYWGNLNNIEPDPSVVDSEKFGRFNSWGYNLEFAYHRNVARWGAMDLFVGGDFGLFTNENEKRFDVTLAPSGEKIQGHILSRGLYLTPSAKLMMRRPESWRFFVGAGLGYYLLDFAELIGGGFESNEVLEKHTVGGYLSLGVDFPLSQSRTGLILGLENKLHLVNFGDLEGFAPGAGDLTGPINIIQLGIAWSN